RRVRPAPRLRWDATVRRGPGLARQPALPRVLPRRQRRGPRREPPDGLDGAGRRPAPRPAGAGPTGLRTSCLWWLSRARALLWGLGGAGAARVVGEGGRRFCG